MKARMKLAISWILTLALVFGCLAGTGMTAKAADATKIQVTVVDAEGNPVEGVKFALQLSSDIVATISSDQNGILEYDVSSYGLEYPQILKLVLAADASHMSETTGINYEVDNGVITQYRIGSSGNYQDYTGNETLKFVVAEKTGETVNRSSLTIKVVDENNNPVTDGGFKLDITETDSAYPQTVSLTNGEYVYREANPNAAEYTITISSKTSGYTLVGDPIKFTTNSSKEIFTVNTKVYDGQPVTMKVKKESATGEPETPNEAKAELLTVINEVKAMDKGVYTEDSWKTVEYALEYAETVYNNPDATDSSISAGKIGLSSAVSRLIKKVSVLTVNVVDQNETPITDAGFKLGIINTRSTQISGVENPCSLENGVLKYTVPDAGEESVYKVQVYSGITGYTATPILVTVNAQREIIKINDNSYDGNPVTMTVTKTGGTAEESADITAVQATPTKVPAEGATVILNVTGTDLTADNWGVKVDRFISGTQNPVSSKAGEATVTKVTENSATINISANGMKNDVDFVFSVGPKTGSAITVQKSVTVTQAGKNYETVTLNQAEVVLADSNTVIATFDEEIFAAKEGEELKKLFYITDYDKSSGSQVTYSLSENDVVSVGDRAVQIRFANAIDLTSQAYLHIKEGALKVEERNNDSVIIEKIANEINQLITSTPRITSIKLDKDILDSNGGTITARLEGYKVTEIDDSAIESAVFFAGETEKTDIEIKKSRDSGVPVLTFTIPGNTTNSTVSYWLSVKVNGIPVYEGASMNRAERATISVLPEGKTDKDHTLSMLTITGNNKPETGDIKNISVEVSQNVGELKTALRLYGTNLDPRLTKVRAIDENGIIWPVYDIPECDGTFRFVAIAGVNKNGVFGEGNTQLIEVLPPRYIGTNKTYRIQVAIDGVHFDESLEVKLTVNNEGVKGDPEFTVCGPDDIKTVTVKYIDKDTKKELAQAETFKGYKVSMLRGFDIQAKTISGYKLVKSPTIGDSFIGDKDRVLTFEYESTTKSVKVNSIKITGPSLKLAAGKKVQLKAVVSPSNATNKAVTWTSSNKKYATVSSTGKVTLMKAGAGKTVTITATAKDGSGKKATYKIKIMKHAVKSISLKAAKTVKAGKKVKVKATVKTTGKSVNKKLKWMTSNKKYATVSSSGVVKTYKAGKGKTVTITVASTDGSNKKKTVKIKIK